MQQKQFPRIMFIFKSEISNWYIGRALNLYFTTIAQLFLEFGWERFWFTVLVSINSNRNYILQFRMTYLNVARMTKEIKNSNRQQVVIVRWLFVC